MTLLRQFILAAILCAGTLALWIVYVPSASAFLERAGVLDENGGAKVGHGSGGMSLLRAA